MRGRNVGFSNERVIMIKKALMAGADPVAIAQLERVSANTIRRIRDGETYNDVYVPGEERMRPEIVVPAGYVPAGGKDHVATRQLAPVSEDEVERRTRESLEKLDAMRVTAKGKPSVDSLIRELEGKPPAPPADPFGESGNG